MPHLVTDLLTDLDVLSPQRSGRLTVFGLRRKPGPALDYQTLDESLATGGLDITEVTEGGSVPTLKVVNKGDTMVLLVAGEQLIGAKQNRVLNTSIMVPAGAETQIPVSCVEQGRWAWKSKSFGSHGTASHSKLRAMMTKQVHDSYFASSTPTSSQGAVWSEVSRKLSKMGSSSASVALEQSYADHAKPLNETLAEIKVPADCAGAAFAVGGQVVGIDLFDRPETLAKLWPKLVRSYALDALEETTDTEPPTPESVRDWLQLTAAAEPKSFRSPGAGEDVRLETATSVGSGLVVEDEPVHVQLFAQVAT